MSIVIGIIVLAIAIFVIYRFLIVSRQNKKINEERFERIKPLIEKLESGQELTPTDILPFARNLLTRESTFRLLSDHNKNDIFPKEFLSIEKGAESNLANWLHFPTELDGCPDEIEHIKKIAIRVKDEDIFYHVFKFRINEPHWAAKNGWMIGVVGPYLYDSKPYDFPPATFSRLSSRFETTSPDEEAKWVHENVAMKR